MATDDIKSPTDTEQKEKSNVLQLHRPEEDEEDCGCSCCGEDCGDPGEYSAEPILDIVERLLDMLAALSQYRDGATDPKNPALQKTERVLLRLLGCAADDLSGVQVGFQPEAEEDEP